ncbi:MAG TPA: hypothetical protein PLO06_11260 [Methanoregulaceae archaeon]|nr:hypothetical protein [Methanoregulaceae archaeon]
MPWICPWCGKENEKDERIGRREPTCRCCGERRIAPEELQKMRDSAIRNLERDLESINDKAHDAREKLAIAENMLEEAQEMHRKAKEDYEELRAEAAPIVTSLSEWKEQPVYFEPRNRAFFAENDRQQAKLPFEVPA